MRGVRPFAGIGWRRCFGELGSFARPEHGRQPVHDLRPAQEHRRILGDAAGRDRPSVEGVDRRRPAAPPRRARTPGCAAGQGTAEAADTSHIASEESCRAQEHAPAAPDRGGRPRRYWATGVVRAPGDPRNRGSGRTSDGGSSSDGPHGPRVYQRSGSRVQGAVVRTAHPTLRTSPRSSSVTRAAMTSWVCMRARGPAHRAARVRPGPPTRRVRASSRSFGGSLGQPVPPKPEVGEQVGGASDQGRRPRGSGPAAPRRGGW